MTAVYPELEIDYSCPALNFSPTTTTWTFHCLASSRCCGVEKLRQVADVLKSVMDLP